MWIGWRTWDNKEDGVFARSQQHADRVFTTKENDTDLQLVIMLDDNDKVIRKHERETRKPICEFKVFT